MLVLVLVAVAVGLEGQQVMRMCIVEDDSAPSGKDDFVLRARHGDSGLPQHDEELAFELARRTRLAVGPLGEEVSEGAGAPPPVPPDVIEPPAQVVDRDQPPAEQVVQRHFEHARRTTPARSAGVRAGGVQGM